MPAPERLKIGLAGGGSTSGLLDTPPQAARQAARAGYVFAHGAGAGMEHAFMAAIAGGLAARGIATLRFQFPYMEKGSKRPDPPPVAQAAVRAAAAEAARRLPGVPLFAGGKSFGGRMTTQAQATEPLPAIRGLVLVGFPLHPAGKPAIDRAAHLGDVQVPMLFLQGTRDALAEISRVRDIAGRLGPRTTLHVVDGADHSFHVPARSGRTDAQVREELLDTMAEWMLAAG